MMRSLLKDPLDRNGIHLKDKYLIKFLHMRVLPDSLEGDSDEAKSRSDGPNLFLM